MQEFNEYIIKEIQVVKQNQIEILEMRNTTEQIRSIKESLTNRMSEGEERISELDDTSFKNTQSETWKRN